MSRDRSVYVFTCTRCGSPQKSEYKDCACTNCGVPTRLIWPTDDYKGKSK